MTEWWQDAARVSMLDQMLPEWAKRAACAEKAPNRAPWDVMFPDDVAMSAKGPDAINWPTRVLQAMKVCSECPVRRQCLTYAFDAEKRQSKMWWSGELVEEDLRYGIYGGTPGPVREWFSRKAPNPEVACDDWFRKFASKKRWSMDEKKEAVA